MKINLKIFGPLIVLLLIITTFYIILPPGSFFVETIYLILPILSVIAGFILFKIYGLNNKNGKTIFWLTLGFLSWTIGEFTWYIFKNFMGIDPFPSIADLFYLLGYPFLFIGLYHELKISEIKINQIKKTTIILITLISIILAAIVVYFGIYQSFDPETNLFSNIISISYNIGDLFLIIISLLTFTVSKVYENGRLALFWMTLSVGFLVFLMADILFAMNQELYESTIKPYVYIDLIWLSGFLLFTYTILNNYFSIRKIKKNLEKEISLTESVNNTEIIS